MRGSHPHGHVDTRSGAACSVTGTQAVPVVLRLPRGPGLQLGSALSPLPTRPLPSSAPRVSPGQPVGRGGLR